MRNKKTKTYTVIGIYEDNHQRYADSFEALEAEDAEVQAIDQARKSGCTLLIAGVVEGNAKVVA